jgi:type I restriction-modification system DNA methylase subunit
LNRYGNRIAYANIILEAVRELLLNHRDEYNLPQVLTNHTRFPEPKEDDFQESLSKINEKEARRKKEGVYYTDRDVTDFLAVNTLLHFVVSSERKVFGYDKAITKLDRLDANLKRRLILATTLDPTCGTGEFLLSVLSIKIRLCQHLNEVRPEDISRSIYGNDIESQSTEITKLRVFFLLVDYYADELDVLQISHNLNQNFTNVDAVVYDRETFGTKDIVIGNPPYVEYRNFNGTPQFSYGNVYADVLHHSVDTLPDNGIMAFVIPLSYISTIRMSNLRNYIMQNTNKQIVMNFADRPDCLFSCVHQKLSIIIAQKNSEFEGILTSSYNYWYQSERKLLFDNIALWRTNVNNEAYWPKVGNKIDSSIYNKFQKMKGEDILHFTSSGIKKGIQINTRGCFWMKAFTRDMKSNSYSTYSVPSQLYSFAYCLVNSSLFFLLWIIISDGWHITNKELSFIKFPKEIGEESIWSNLASRLEDKLEKTKVYVGTKQVDYEYKHKSCKDIIDEIDNELAKIYKLSQTQLEYIKNFGLKYRLGDGA